MKLSSCGCTNMCKSASKSFHVQKVPRDAQGRAALRVWLSPAEPKEPSDLKPIIVFFHGGGLLSSATTYVPFLCPRFCQHCAESGKICVEVDYPLSCLPWEVSAIMPAVATFAAWLLQAHVSVIVGIWLAFVAWRLWCPRVKHPQHLRACALAVEWARVNALRYGGDANNIILWGHSSGGQLAALLALASADAFNGNEASIGPVAGLAVLSSPLDYRSENLVHLHPLARVVVRGLLLREQFGVDPKTWEQASPIRWLEGAVTKPPNMCPTMPLMLLRTGLEFVVPFINQQAELIFKFDDAANLAKKQGMPVFQHCVNGRDHFTALACCALWLQDEHPFWQHTRARAAALRKVSCQSHHS